MENFLSSLSKLFRRKRNEGRIPEPPSVSQKETTPQPLQEPLIPQTPRARKRNQVKGSRAEVAQSGKPKRKATPQKSSGQKKGRPPKIEPKT